MRQRLGFGLSLCVAAALHGVILLVPHFAGREAVTLPTMEIAILSEPAGPSIAGHPAPALGVIGQPAAAPMRQVVAIAQQTPPEPAAARAPAPEPATEDDAAPPAPATADVTTEDAGPTQPSTTAGPVDAGQPGELAHDGVGGSGGNGALSSTGTGTGNAANGPGSGTATDADGLLAPRPLADIHPAYPRTARRAGWEGVVRVSALVDETGVVISAEIAATSGHTALDQAALEAVRMTVFTPAQQAGKPVACRVIIPIRFQLQ